MRIPTLQLQMSEQSGKWQLEAIHKSYFCVIRKLIMDVEALGCGAWLD